MKAVVVRGLSEVAVEDVEPARIEAPTDILMRVTSSAICGTDLQSISLSVIRRNKFSSSVHVYAKTQALHGAAKAR